MNENEVVRVSDLRKHYGDRTVVDGVSFDVMAGEIVGLIGSNGAGKTTTVECIQGLRRPDSGTLRVLGYDPTADADRLRPLIGTQLQDSSLPDRLRVAEALLLFGTGQPDYGDDLLDRFGLADRRRSPFASLSGGERQRLFLVLALLNRPKLVILDELTQGLDPVARRNVWSAVDELRADGTTVLLVTHDVDEAEALCDRVVAMSAGHVLDAGTPSELVDRYGRRATIRFTPTEPAVALPAELAELEGVDDVSFDAGRVTVHGNRASIAHVGAALVRWGAVPEDLTVSVPNLEDALVGLLERADATTATATTPEGRNPAAELIGAQP